MNCNLTLRPPATLSYAIPFHRQIPHRPSVSLPSIYHNIPDYAVPLIPVSPPHCPRFPPFPFCVSLPMMHHTPYPLSFPLLDQWAPSWPDVPTFTKPKPDPSWFAYPYPPNPHPPPPRRRPYPRLEQTAASLTSSRPTHTHSSRTRTHPIRTQVPPALSALPALPISLPMPALERESCLLPIWVLFSIDLGELLSSDRLPLGFWIADVNGCATHTCTGVSPCGVQCAIIGTQAPSLSAPRVS